MLDRILTYVLPEVCVTSASIAFGRDGYFIDVGDLYSDEHATYWKAFREKFPNCDRVASKYGASILTCPEFPTIEDLLRWFAEVTRLPPSIKNLLKMEALRKC